MCLLLRLARTRLGRRLTGWILAPMSQFLPLDRLAETRRLVAFRHPQPAYPFQALIVPKSQAASLEALDPSESDFLTDRYATVQRRVKEFDLVEGGFWLIVNGGRFRVFRHCIFSSSVAIRFHKNRRGVLV